MPISEWWVKSQLTRLIKNVSISSHGALVCSIHTLLLKIITMQKVKQNYIAELIIISAVAIALLTSCSTNKQKPIKCCEKDSTHALWNCGKSIEYKHSELITN